MRTLRKSHRPDIGTLLRWWRKRRGLSQMALAHAAGVSPRHMSFMETGRSRPGRDVLLRVADALELPFRQVNVLLESAGYARMYGESALTNEELEGLSGILEFVLERYEPYGAVVVDAEWTLLMANRGHRRLANYVLADGGAGIPEERNLLLQLFRPGGFRDRLVNWPEVAHHLLERLRRQVAEDPARETLRTLLETLEAEDLPPEPEARIPDLPVLPMHFAVDDRRLSLVSLVTTFGAPQDVTTQELRLEAFLPGDRESDELIRSLAAHGEHYARGHSIGRSPLDLATAGDDPG